MSEHTGGDGPLDAESLGGPGVASYLLALSRGRVTDALVALVGAERVCMLAPKVVDRLEKTWSAEQGLLRTGRLDEDDFAGIWACEVRGKAHIEEGRHLHLLVVIGVTTDGRKDFLAIEEGQPESVDAWEGLLRGLCDRGMRAPGMAAADGTAAFWKALATVWPDTKAQRS